MGAPAPCLQWPHSYARVFRGALPRGLLAQLAREADAIAHCPNFWVPQAVLAGAEPPRTPGEAAVVQLYRTAAPLLPPGGCAGAEWWVQVYQPGKGLAFHFDKDEQRFKECGLMLHPTLSSVLSLTGPAVGALPLGPTIVVDQQFNAAAGRAVPEHPQRAALVWPAAGQYALFDGRLAHGVLESFSPARRATLLVNWWPARPQGVERVSLEQMQRHGLSQCQPSATKAAAYSPASPRQPSQPAVDAPAAMPAEAGGQPAAGAQAGQGATPPLHGSSGQMQSNGACCGTGRAAAGTWRGSAALPKGCKGIDSTAADASDPCSPVEVAVPVFAYAPAGEPAEVLDAILAAQGIRVSLHAQDGQTAGQQAACAGHDELCTAVAFEHPGFELYPLAVEDYADSSHETALALVPVGMMGASQSDSD